MVTQVPSEETPYDPDLYRLTTRTGLVCELQQGVGITRIIEPNGSTITYTENGVFHSDGRSVAIERRNFNKFSTYIDYVDVVRCEPHV